MKRQTKAKRWGRFCFNTLSAISLMFAIVMAGLWVRSIAEPVLFTVPLIRSRTLSIDVSHGALSAVIHRRELGRPGELNESPYPDFALLDYEDEDLWKRV